MIRIIAAVAGIAVLGAGWQYERASHADTRADYAALVASNAEAQRLALVALRAREKAHAEALQAVAQRSAREKSRIDSELRIALDSLRSRPDRAATDTVPGGAANKLGCTGADLARPDAEFLARYDSIVAGLEDAVGECRAHYDEAVKLTAPVLH